MNLLDLIQNDFETEINKDPREGFGKDTERFKSALTVLDSAQDNQEKLDAVEKLIELVKERYP